ncbi:hypothetical protein LCGC14_1834420 [marine sediment metagenome]|uniref:Uncharacterized protein n=1 Tax=marine sediment metagenome TaxID=412755 RepID=A0A0F9GF29_9ZZZZ
MAIFRPDANPETDCLDGILRMTDSDLSWSTIRTGVLGDIIGADALSSSELRIESDASQDKWYWLTRGVVGFNTVSIPNDITILSATLSLYGVVKRDHLGITPNINIYSTTLTNNTDISPTDADLLTNYQAFGNTAFSTAISYASWDATGWNNFVLNQNGIDYISKTGVTNFGIRNANYDVAGIEPAWTANEEAYLTWWAAEYLDGIYAPKLTVNYTTSTLTAGNFAVVETRLHYVSADSVERYIPGIIIGDAVNAVGNVAVVEERIQYVGATSSKERYWLGTLIGDAINPAGSIAVVENRMQYVDTSNKERYIKGVPV